MLQSFASIERGNPPPRRKSCLACIKARRRCDQASPACQRCAQRNIDCQYPQGARSKRGPGLVPSPAPASPSAHMSGAEQQIESLSDLVVTPQVSFDMLDTILEPPEDFLSNLFPTFLECADATPSLDASRALINPALLVTAQQALERSRFVTDSQANKAITSRLQYAIDKISAAPRQMVLENQMPWCHAHLYDDGMPRSMQCVPVAPKRAPPNLGRLANRSRRCGLVRRPARGQERRQCPGDPRLQREPTSRSAL